MKKTISVGIATYNRSKFLKQTVDYIINQNEDSVIEIIIVDQTPDKEITDELKAYFGAFNFKIIYIIQTKPEVCRARNTIILNAKGDIIIFFDDDVILGEKCISSHLSAYNYEGIKSCIGHIHHRKPNFNVDSLDICKPRIGTENSIGDDAALDLNYKGVSISCNQSFDRNILIELGGFDENFIGGYYEDADMGLRLKRSGYKIAFHPEAMVVHIKAPQGGLRFEVKQPFSEVERLLSYALFIHRYPTEYGFFESLKSILRAGPFRKVNVVNPINHIKSWRNLLISFIAAYRVKKSVKSIIFKNDQS